MRKGRSSMGIPSQKLPMYTKETKSNSKNFAAIDSDRTFERADSPILKVFPGKSPMKSPEPFERNGDPEYGFKQIFSSMTKLRKSSLRIELTKGVEKIKRGFRNLISEEEDDADVRSRHSSKRRLGNALLESQISSKATGQVSGFVLGSKPNTEGI